MALNQLPPVPSVDQNPGDALVEAWDMFKTGLTTDIRVVPANPNLIPRIIVIVTENPTPTVGPNAADTEQIALRIRQGFFSGNPANLAVVNPSMVPHQINIFAVGTFY